MVSVVTATHNRAERLRPCSRVSPRRRCPTSVRGGRSSTTRRLTRRATSSTASRAAGSSACARLGTRARGPADGAQPRLAAGRAPLVAFTDDDCVPTRAGSRRSRPPPAAPTIVTGRTLARPRGEPRARPVREDRFDHPARARTTRPATSPIRAPFSSASAASTSLPEPGRRGLRPGLARRRRLAACPASRPRRWSTTRCSRAGRSARSGTPFWRPRASQAYKRNPELRAHLALGVFYDRSHPLLAQAAVGAVARAPQPARAGAGSPYLGNVAEPLPRQRGRLTHTPSTPCSTRCRSPPPCAGPCATAPSSSRRRQ